MASQILFNIHDLALLLAIWTCVTHIFIVLFHKQAKNYRTFLILFLASAAFYSLDTLIYWSPSIKRVVFELSPHIFFIVKFALFLQAPFLYFFIKSLIYKEFAFSRFDCLHFLPAVCYLLSIPILYLSINSYSHIHEAVWNYGVLYNNVVFNVWLWIEKCSYLVYGAWVLILLHKYKSQLVNYTSNMEGIGPVWIQLLVVGFVFLWLCNTFAQIFTQLDMSGHVWALTQNYSRLILLNVLVVLSLSRRTVRQSDLTVQLTQTELPQYTGEQIARVNQAMAERKVYLNPDLSLEQLADITSLPQRILSLIINRHYELNFFEFVNEYRVEHAKALLTDTDLPVIEVMAESGFNSKSAFNRFFKKFTEQTPTQFRSQHSQSLQNS